MSTPLLFPPVGTTLSDYQQYDASFQQACCGVAGMCNLYFERRARNNCSFYMPQRRGMFLRVSVQGYVVYAISFQLLQMEILILLPWMA